MPSPFPGMDPYLEGNWWTSFHAFYAPEIARQLNRQLRPKYIASPEREYTAGALDDILISPTDYIPDVTIRKSRGRGKFESNDGVMTAPIEAAYPACHEGAAFSRANSRHGEAPAGDRHRIIVSDQQAQWA